MQKNASLAAGAREYPYPITTLKQKIIRYLHGNHLAALPAGNLLVIFATRNDQVNTMTAFRVNLTALSLLALLVGIFLIYNTMTFSVIQRRAMFGPLRSLGYTREQVFGMVLGEAALAGASKVCLHTRPPLVALEPATYS